MSPADHAAWISARATVWAAAFSGFSMLGVLWGAYVATRAAKTWRGVHEAAAADQCVATAYECLSAVDRVITMRWAFNRAAPPVGREMVVFPEEAFNEAWAAWRRFRIAHVVASRYYADRLPAPAPDRIAEQINALQDWCGTFYGRSPGDTPGTEINLRRAANHRSDEIRAAVEAVANQVAEILQPAPPISLCSRTRDFTTTAWARVRQLRSAKGTP